MPTFDTPRAGKLGYGDRDAALRQLRDTAKLERLAMQAGQKIGLRTRRAVTGAFRDGRDPMTALREHSKETRGVLVNLMVTAHLDGRRRTLINAAPRIREVRKLQLATTVFDGALAFLQKRLEASDEDINALRQQYGPEALRVVGAMENKVERQLVGAIQASAAQGETRRQGVKRLRQAFSDAGVDPDNAFTFEAVFRTQTQQAYGAGRWNALRNDPAVDEILWGFRYSTVGDDRVRPSHAMLEGTTLPKDDPFWATHWTPNGWACRCQVLEIFRGDEPDAPVQPLTEIEIEGEVIRSGPDPGFAMNPGQLFRDPRSLKPATRNIVPAPIDEVAIVSRSNLSTGINQTERVTLEDGREAVVKPDSGFRQVLDEQPPSITEPAAWEVDQAMELGMVPETRQMRGASLQSWVDDALSAHDREPSVGQQEDLAVFDYIIGNTDRHRKNVMTRSDGTVFAIDNSISLPNSFRPSRAMRNSLLLNMPVGSGVPLNARRVGFARNLLNKRGEVEGRLNELGVERNRIDFMFQRAEKVVESEGRTLGLDGRGLPSVF